MSNLDLIAMGEPMIEFSQLPPERGGRIDGRLFLKGFGGDASNFAIAAARQGARTAFITKLGDDAHGAEIRALWRREGVDDRMTPSDPMHPTAAHFVTHDENGHHFSYLRAGSAASRLQSSDIGEDMFQGARFLHFTGISLAISAAARSACFAAAALAKGAGLRISFDTNLRLKLWTLEEAKEPMMRAITSCDVLLPSIDDVTALSGLDDPEAIADWCQAQGPSIVALKLGGAGAIIADGESRFRIPPFPCQPVDATGAGDAFGGAFIARLLAGDAPEKAGLYAAATAALSTEGYGAVDPIPTRDRVLEAMARF
jgi:2-dehydro-3-deoxygluconokinase